MKAIILPVLLLSLTVFLTCGRLDDQAPMAQFNVVYPSPTTPVDENNKICVGFYNKSDWTEFGGAFCTASTFFGSTDTYSFLAPTVPFSSAYVVAWQDTTPDGVPTAGEPAMGYDGIVHPATLTQLVFPKLSYIQITIQLNNTDVY